VCHKINEKKLLLKVHFAKTVKVDPSTELIEIEDEGMLGLRKFYVLICSI
jgi:hypothetical protein